MKTTLYLIRQGAAEEGSQNNRSLGPLGVRQAELTRDFLAVRPIDHCYACSTRRALETAAIIARPHGLVPVTLQALEINSPNPVRSTLDRLFDRHVGMGFMVIAQADLQRCYLAQILGVAEDFASDMNLDHCGISVVTREAEKTMVHTLNASFHLQGMAA